MKKHLIAFLLSLSFACAVGGFAGCTQDDSSSPNSSPSDTLSDGGDSSDTSDDTGSEEETGYALHFTQDDGFEYIMETIDGKAYESLDGVKAEEGSVVSFNVDLGAFYTGYPIVLVNGSSIPLDKNGLYTFTVEGESTIKVNGIEKDVSNMEGDGSFANAFIVTRPIDLLHIAEQVNKGVSSYTNGAFVLANDIDCKGAELEVIGNLRNENAYFSGCFSSNDNPDTPETERYTISNFTINSDDSNYVGLFGAVYVNPSIEGSGLFYGISLDNFSITASLTNPVDPATKTITCGSLVAYGVGVRLYMCDATNGVMNVYADDIYFSYAGGLLGYQQSFYNEGYGSYPAEIAYSAVDVDINVLQGTVMYAGGVSGYMVTNYAYTPVLLHNAYSLGNVTGAFRSGGIAGYLGQYSSVTNCYATGEISASVTTMSVDTTPESAYEYLHAYAGGLVGFADNDSVVNDCFFVGSTKASTVSGSQSVYAHTDAIVGGGYEAGNLYATGQKYIVDNCLFGNGVNVADSTALKNALVWNDADWLFENGKYPVINYNPIEETFTTTLTLRYVAKAADGSMQPVSVNGETEKVFNYFDSAEGLYAPLADAFLGENLSPYLTADDGKNLSFGYYFDEACTKKAPLAYLATKNITLYVGFANPEAILGTYTLLTDNNANAMEITLTADGRVAYTDGASVQTTNFLYNGETLVIELARLARYYDGEIVVTDETLDENFDMERYQVYDYVGSVVNGRMSLYDGLYFTEESPLVAVKSLFVGAFYLENGTHYEFYGEKGVEKLNDTEKEFTYTVNGDTVQLSFGSQNVTLNKADLKAYDAFKGVWTKSVVFNKTFTFDGKGGWTAEATVDGFIDVLNGAYTVSPDGKSLSLDNGYTASFNTQGFLEITGDNKTQIYYANGDAFVGQWTYGANKAIVLTLNGLAQNGLGTARAVYSSGYDYALTYEASETDGYYVLYLDGGIFGYFTYTGSAQRGYLTARLYNPVDAVEDYTAYSLTRIDDYAGEWISNNEELNTIAFDGLAFTGENGKATVTYIENGEEKDVTLNYYLEGFTLKGTFFYNETLYTLVFDEDEQSVTVISESNVETEMQRKDRFAGYTFIDTDGNEYVFDGKGALDRGGKFTVGNATYYYKKVSETEFAVYESTYAEGATAIGSITVVTENETEKYYALTGIGETKNLYIKNALMGEWAISGAYALIEIGATSLDGKIPAKFFKTESFGGYATELVYLDSTTLYTHYTANNAPYDYYLFMQEGDSMVLTETANLYASEWIAVSRVDDLFGTWTSSETGTTLSFDGVQSPFSYGIAKQVSTNYGTTATQTDYYYTIKDGGILMWTQNSAEIKYYKIETFDNATDGAYVNGERSINRTRVDSLYLTQATDENGVVYTFNGGNINGKNGELVATKTVHGQTQTVATYSYEVNAYNSNSTATITLVDKATNKTYIATLNYQDAINVTITLTEQTENA